MWGAILGSDGRRVWVTVFYGFYLTTALNPKPYCILLGSAIGLPDREHDLQSWPAKHGAVGDLGEGGRESLSFSYGLNPHMSCSLNSYSPLS